MKVCVPLSRFAGLFLRQGARDADEGGAGQEAARAVWRLHEQRAAGLGSEVGSVDSVGAEAKQRLAARVEDVGGVGAYAFVEEEEEEKKRKRIRERKR